MKINGHGLKSFRVKYRSSHDSDAIVWEELVANCRDKTEAINKVLNTFYWTAHMTINDGDKNVLILYNIDSVEEEMRSE